MRVALICLTQKMQPITPKIQNIYSDQNYPYGKKFLKYETGDSYAEIYNKGYLVTSIKESFQNGPIFALNRSVRVSLKNFEPNSENRRILRKTDYMDFQVLNNSDNQQNEKPNFKYDPITVGKFCFDNFKKRFPENPMHISRIKRIFTGGVFNRIFVFFEKQKEGGKIQDTRHKIQEKKSKILSEFQTQTSSLRNPEPNPETQIPNPQILNTKYQIPSPIGYTATLVHDNIIHYAYPFNDQKYYKQNIGMGMMLRAIIWAKENNLDYIYLGTCNTIPALYKLQFKGIEWFDGEGWSGDTHELKKIVRGGNEER